MSYHQPDTLRHQVHNEPGAGSAGASAAYYLDKFKNPCDRVNITVFERSSYVGGRSTTVNVYDDPTEPVELGASIFVEANKNLVSAIKELGLITTSRSSKELPGTLGVWDGLYWKFISSESSWWTKAMLLWKYGLAPIRTQNIVKQTIGKFLKMYEEPHFPFRDLSQTAYDLGLTEATAATGEEFLVNNGIESPFSTDIIQASTRVNYAQNLNKIHALESLVCMSTDGAMQVQGGNWQIFDGMLKVSGAHVLLNTSVTSINRQSDGTYAINALSSNLEVQSTSHDAIILAAPFQYAGLTFQPALPNPPHEIPYVNLQVTLFTSPSALDPQTFGLNANGKVPNTILTTISDSQHFHPDFFSISTLRRVHNSMTGRREYLYKVFSLEPLEDEFFERFLLLSPDGSPITWRYDKLWQSYPYLSPRVTFEDIQRDKEGKVWYTSGIESFISTMETSSLMGMNVARLITDGWADGDSPLEKETLGGDVPQRLQAAQEL